MPYSDLNASAAAEVIFISTLYSLPYKQYYIMIFASKANQKYDIRIARTVN